jgi:DNA/RNA endonuclease YhcR with UshA esterase domain
MKKILYLILVLICVVSCQNKYSEPEIEMPMYALEDSLDAGWEIKTIEEFQLMNNSEVPYQVTEKYLMKGIVTADDESGNIYKSIYIQDETAGICLSLDLVNIYNYMARGQEVIIEMKGMWLGKYLGAYQVGDSTTHFQYGYQMGRYDWTKELLQKHFYTNGFPDLEKVPAPKEIQSAGEILSTDYGMLVKLKNVTFPDTKGGKLKSWSTSEQTENRKVVFSDGSQIIVRTSGYSNFYADYMPEGVGTITGIISIYNGTVQLYLRDRDDVGRFLVKE